MCSGSVVRVCYCVGMGGKVRCRGKISVMGYQKWVSHIHVVLWRVYAGCGGICLCCVCNIHALWFVQCVVDEACMPCFVVGMYVVLHTGNIRYVYSGFGM